MKRRAFLASPLLAVARRASPRRDYPAVVPGVALAFPRDHGAHPAFRTEWWYVTGWLRDAAGSDFGIQITFFRNRPGVAEDSPSAFAPRQLVFAHAALGRSAPRARCCTTSARRARDSASPEPRRRRRDAWIGDWSLALDGEAYVARIAAREFAFDLRFAPTQPILLQGDAGYSRKGPDPLQASYYYSRPQLAVAGTRRRSPARRCRGHRHGVARSRVVERGDGAGGGRLGLGRHQSRRRRRADGVPRCATAPAARCGPAARMRGGRRAHAHLRPGRGPLRAAAALALAAHAGRVSRGDDASAPAAPSTRWRRCSTIRSSIRARAPAPSTGKARCAREQGGREVGRGYLELTGYGKPLQL